MNWRAVGQARFALGESPFWHPQDRALYGVDIAGHSIWRISSAGLADVWTTPSQLGEPACLAPVRGGGLVVGMRSGIYRVAQWRGDFERLAPAPYDTAVLRFNDGKADPQGRFWASTYSEDKRPNACLYALDARDGSAPVLTPAATALPQGATGGNGLAWSPDGTTLYWADTAAHVVRAWDWDGHFNTLQNGRVFHQFDAKPADWAYGQPGFDTYQGRPDGAAVDAQGNYWVAMYEGGCVKKLSPAGELLETWPTPALCPTMPCFGGDDLQTLFVTTASKGRSVQELADLPWSGQVLSMRVAVPGFPVNFFAA